MVGWHDRLDGHQFEHVLGVDDEQRILACCSPRGCKESDTTQWLNWRICMFIYTLRTSILLPLVILPIVHSLSCVRLCNPINCSNPGASVLHCFLEFAQIHVHWVNTIYLSYPLLLPSPFAFHLSQHQDLFQWVSSSYQVSKVLELQLQQPSFQWIFRVDIL